MHVVSQSIKGYRPELGYVGSFSGPQWGPADAPLTCSTLVAQGSDTQVNSLEYLKILHKSTEGLIWVKFPFQRKTLQYWPPLWMLIFPNPALACLILPLDHTIPRATMSWLYQADHRTNFQGSGDLALRIWFLSKCKVPAKYSLWAAVLPLLTKYTLQMKKPTMLSELLI